MQLFEISTKDQSQTTHCIDKELINLISSLWRLCSVKQGLCKDMENADQRRPHIMMRRPDFKLNNNEALLTA